MDGSNAGHPLRYKPTLVQSLSALGEPVSKLRKSVQEVEVPCATYGTSFHKLTYVAVEIVP